MIDSAIQRIAQFWVYGTGPAALLLLALWPILLSDQPLPVILAYLAIPAYMFHQVEEHDADRFRLFVNKLLGQKRAGLSQTDVAVINLGVVWLPLMLVFWLTHSVNSGWAVLSGWLMLMNGIAHVGQAVALRCPNPGVITGLALLVPLGLALILMAGATPLQQGVGLLLSIAIHAGIVFRATRPVSRETVQ